MTGWVRTNVCPTHGEEEDEDGANADDDIASEEEPRGDDEAGGADEPRKEEEGGPEEEGLTDEEGPTDDDGLSEEEGGGALTTSLTFILPPLVGQWTG
jgi:hypothetical protein